MKKAWIGLALALGFAQTASADNVALCEALTIKAIPADNAQGEAQLATYHPAVNFFISLYDEQAGHLTEIKGLPIRAIMCRRNDVIPSETDYEILATGVPFVLSQNFDSPDSDSLTIYWKEDVLDYVHKGQPLSDEAQARLDSRLAEFTALGRHELSVDDAAIELDSETPVSKDSDELNATADHEVQDGVEDQYLLASERLEDTLEESPP